MATRVNFPSIDRSRLSDISVRLAIPTDRRAFVWQLMTAPWWVWSDLPKLPRPSHDPVLPVGGLAGDWVVHGLDRIATRIWIQRMMAIIVRGLGLGILAGSVWLAIELLGGPEFDPRFWFGIGIALMIWSLIVAALSRPTRIQIAQMLDRSFALQERMTTALGNIGQELPAEDQAVSVVYLQIADAANAITMVQEQPIFRFRLPVRELVLAVALGLTFAALAFARGTGGAVPDVQTNAVPVFVPAAQRFVPPTADRSVPADQTVPSVADVQQMVQTSLDNQQDLQTLANALNDHAMTHDAAQSIRQGDYTGAAEELRSVSAQADQLSQTARDDLAADLNQAASQMSTGNQTLGGATQQAADGLQTGGEPAKTGVRNLANAVEQSGQQVQSSEALDQAMQQAQQQEASSGSGANQQTQSGSSQQANNGTGGQQQATSSSADGSSQPGQSDANTGANAEAGLGADSDSSSGESGNGAPATADQPGAPGQQAGTGPGKSSDMGGSASGQSSQTSASDRTGETENANQGAGAGQGGSELNAQGVADSEVGGAAQNESAGRESSGIRVSDAEQTSGAAASELGDGNHEAVELSRAPRGESVQIGGSSGASSLGSGAGVTVSSGSAQQSDVGQNGPDSNHVPSEYRDIVESYFSDKDKGG